MKEWVKAPALPVLHRVGDAAAQQHAGWVVHGDGRRIGSWRAGVRHPADDLRERRVRAGADEGEQAADQGGGSS